MKVRFLELVRRRIKSEEPHIPRCGAVPFSGAKYRSVGNAVDTSTFKKKNKTTQEKFWRAKPDESNQVNDIKTKKPSQPSVGLSCSTPNLHQYGQQLSSRPETIDKMAEKYIQGIYAESQDRQIRKYEGVIDYTPVDRIVDKVLAWISSHLVEIPFLNRLNPIAIFFVSRRDKSAVQKYESPFRQCGCRIETRTTLRSFCRSINVKTPPIVHYLSDPKVEPVMSNGVYVSSFDYEGSKDVAERAKLWCASAYGYRQNWRSQSESVKFYERFYDALLQGRSVFDAYARISRMVEIAPLQFTMRIADFRIPIPKVNVNLQMKGVYETTGNI